MNIKKLITNIALPLAVGGLSAILTREGTMEFGNIPKPTFTPPAIVFPIVWTILYILMGLATYYVSVSDNARKDTAVSYYYIQLVFNFLWSIVFFNMKSYTLAFIDLIVMLFFVVITTVMYFRIDKKAGCLMLPYIVWLILAGILNVGVIMLN